MKDHFWIIQAMFMCVRALETVESCNPGFENMGKGKHGKRGEHGEHGKDGKHQPDDLEHSIYDSKHSIRQPNDSKHSILQHLL